jgi:sortase A
MRTLLERVLLVAGTACLVLVSFAWITRVSFQAKARHALAVAPQSPIASDPGDSLIGILEVPRLGVSVVVIDGDDDAVLARGVGHLPDTALPWKRGNMAIAGHRDTFFRLLKHARVGDALFLLTPRGTFAYKARRIRIVAPDDLSVLKDADGVALTLITCYPFSYIGSAPKRFVLQAERQ